jgi:uncharacterized membrane-anchored protein
MSFEPHPWRGMVLGEVHARPFADIAPPRRILHFAFMTDAELAERDRKAFGEFCAARGHRGPEAGSKYHRVELAGTALRWEQHAEFTTYSWGFRSADRAPFETSPAALAKLMSELPQPGPHLVSVDLHYLEERGHKAWRQAFDPASLAACRKGGGKALAATDFRATPDGYVKILVLGQKLPPLRAGALILQLLELETYRSLCLLGLPVARALQPEIRDHERRLDEITAGMKAAAGLSADRALLDRLMELAGELEAGASRTHFRFGATKAYAELVRTRITGLEEEPVEGIQTISSFLERRFAPAVRTCASVEERQEKLSGKLVRAAELLRTRVDIEREQQNAELLAAMNERTRLQLRLQQTVEGLSIAAISYYVVQLVYYVAAPFGLEARPDAKWIKAGLALAVIAAVALIVRSIRRRHDSDAPPPKIN